MPDDSVGNSEATRHNTLTDSVPALLAQKSRDTWTTDLRLVLVIAAPNVASSVAQTLLSLVDYAIVSQLGKEAQAAVSTGGMVFFTIFAMLLGMMVCVTTVVSQSLGVKRYRDCSAYAWQGIWFSLLFGVGVMALWPIMPGFYDWLGHDSAVQTMEVSYTRIRLWSLGAAGASVALGHFFNGIHKPLQNAISVVFANILNGLLSYALVFGKWGFPEMGADGAAWGTVVASIVRLFWLMALMYYGREVALFDARHTWHVDWEKMRRLVRIGWPAGVSFVMDIAAWAAFLAGIIGKFGTEHLAATATCWRYTELSFMPAIGIAMAVSTTVGKAIGENRIDLARRRATIGTILNMGCMGTMALLFVLFRHYLIYVFSKEGEVISIGAELMIFVAMFQLFDAIAITYGNALRGAGDTLWPAVVGGIQSWGIMIGGGWLIALHRPDLGSKGPWIFCTLYVIIIGITLWIRWHRGKWEHLDVIGRKEANLG